MVLASVSVLFVLVIWSRHVSAYPTNNELCATFHISSNDSDIFELFKNTKTDTNELKSFRGRQLSSLSKHCELEICGYSRNDTNYKRSCFWYTEASMQDKQFSPSSQFDDNYEIVFASCTCTSSSKPDNCKLETCTLRNETKIWKFGECAVLYQETNCNTCHFTPVNLMKNHKFLTKNTHHFKSMLVRPGCVVEKETKGYEMNEILNIMERLWLDQTKCLDGIVETTQPAFYKDMDNYTCYCQDPSTIVSVILTAEIPTTNPDTTTSPTHTAWTTSIWFVGLGLLIVCVAVTIYFRRHNLSTTFLTNIKNHTVFKPFISNRNSDKRAGILNEEQLTGISSADNALPLTSENQLKLEIMDEVHRLINLRFGTFEPDDDSIMMTSSIGGESLPSNVEWNKQLTEKFHKICSSEHVLSRKSFCVSKRDLENPLGSGQFGIVYKGSLRNEQDGPVINVAIKKINSSSTLEGNVLQSFFREIKTFQIINNGSTNVVEFMGACCHTNGFYILTKFCEGGSLRKHLIDVLRPKIKGIEIPALEIDVNVGDDYYSTDKIKEHQWQESAKNVKLKDANLHQMLFWCEEIASGMEYLGEKGIIHVDLATRNILLSSTNCDTMGIKICDFGLSRKCLNKEDYARSLLTGEFPFNSLAPESITEGEGEPRKISMQLDIWAFGCTVWEIFTLGDVLYPDVAECGIRKFLAVKKLLQEGYIHPKPELAPVNVYDDVMLKCWENDPRRRINFSELRKCFGTMRTAIGVEKL